MTKSNKGYSSPNLQRSVFDTRVEKRTFKMSDQNQLMGDSHPHARLTDAQVDWIRDIYEEGFVGYKTLAQAFGVPKATIQSICNYYRRSATLDRFVVMERPVRSDSVSVFSMADVALLRVFHRTGGNLSALATRLGVRYEVILEAVNGVLPAYDE